MEKKLPKFKVGDRVHPKHWIDMSSGGIMWSEDNGTITDIYEVTTNPFAIGTHGCIVKADKGGMFIAHETAWSLI